MKINPLNNEIEAYEAISKAIEKLKELAKLYNRVDKVENAYVNDIIALYKIRENYIIAKSMDI